MVNYSGQPWTPPNGMTPITQLDIFNPQNQGASQQPAADRDNTVLGLGVLASLVFLSVTVVYLWSKQ